MMAEKTKADLEAELASAQQENASLRRQLDERPWATAAARPANPEPRFELSAGEAADLAAHGHTRSARTGETILASEFPDQVAAVDANMADPDEDREQARLERRQAAEDAARADRDARRARREHDARIAGI